MAPESVSLCSRDQRDRVVFFFFSLYSHPELFLNNLCQASKADELNQR